MNSNRITCAIGDVHGRCDLLEATIEHAKSEARDLGRDMRFVFIGDIVDRGHDSMGSMYATAEAIAQHEGSLITLGNHDDWFLKAMTEQDWEYAEQWAAKGGAATMMSYGDIDFEWVRETVRSYHPSHLDLIRKASISETDGRFHFVHAGINPTRPLWAQDRKDALWIRDPFLNHVGELSHVIVHGHSPTENDLPVVTENRISIDTGAYRSGRLTSLMIDPVARDIRFYQTDGRASSIVRVYAERMDRGLGTVLDDVDGLFENENALALAA